MKTADLLAAGRQWQQAGDLPRAEAACRQSLALAPTSAEAGCALGFRAFFERETRRSRRVFSGALAAGGGRVPGPGHPALVPTKPPRRLGRGHGTHGTGAVVDAARKPSHPSNVERPA